MSDCPMEVSHIMGWWKDKGPPIIGTALIVAGGVTVVASYASASPTLGIVSQGAIAAEKPLAVRLRVDNPAVVPIVVENAGCGCNMTLSFPQSLRVAPLSSSEFLATIDVSSEPVGKRSALIKLATFVGDRFVPLVAEVEYEVRR
ncbi:MAG: hypothetical protein KIS66_15665 [Fimbriimonadaceae bacterium]|nr:hypothetical protein [Fimbriimonadaceae bacterium]